MRSMRKSLSSSMGNTASFSGSTGGAFDVGAGAGVGAGMGMGTYVIVGGPQETTADTSKTPTEKSPREHREIMTRRRS